MTHTTRPQGVPTDEVALLWGSHTRDRGGHRKSIMAIALAVILCLTTCTAVYATWRIQTINSGTSLAAGSVAGPTALTFAKRRFISTLSWTLPPTVQQGKQQLVLESTTGAAGTYTTYATINNGTTATQTLFGRFAKNDCFEVETVYNTWTALSTSVCA